MKTIYYILMSLAFVSLITDGDFAYGFAKPVQDLIPMEALIRKDLRRLRLACTQEELKELDYIGELLKDDNTRQAYRMLDVMIRRNDCQAALLTKALVFIINNQCDQLAYIENHLDPRLHSQRVIRKILQNQQPEKKYELLVKNSPKL
jgi:hypothetical protein